MKRTLYSLLSLFILLVFLWPALWDYHKVGHGDWDLALSNHFSHFTSLYQYGEVLLWNPWICGGKNAFGMTGLREIGITLLLGSFLPFLLAQKLSILFYFFTAFLGFYLFSHRVVKNESLYAPLFVSILFVFNGSMIKHLEEGHIVFLPVCFFPLLFSFLEISIHERKIHYTLLASLLTVLFLYTGVTYPTIYLFTLLFFYFMFKILFSPHRKRALLVGGGFSLITLLIASPKLILLYDHLKEFPIARKRAVHEHLPFAGVWRSLISPIPHKIGRWKWHERSFYVGSTALLISLVSLFFLLPLRVYKKKVTLTEVSFLTTAFVCFLMILGAYSPYSPHVFSHSLPLFKSMHVTGRWFFPFLFCFCLFLLFALKEVQFSARTHKKLFSLFSHALFITLLLGLGFELFTSQRKFIENFAKIEVPWEDELDQFPVHTEEEAFTVIKTPGPYFYGPRSPMLPMILQNEASRICYSPMSKRRRVIEMNKAIVHILNPHPSSSLHDIEFSPNKVSFRANLEKEEIILLNQNFSSHWHVTGYPITKKRLKPAVILPPGKHENISFYFWPKGLTLGIFLSLFGLLLTASIFYLDRYKQALL